ncbi:MAG TPA: hypothetical protein VN493_23220 [Thermoanaerobaculia bacterium]|nr:hypothetical protein [Thermoanaerobaculia bacterium]
MDQELIAYLDKRFGEVNERIDSRFRETGVEIESLRGQIQQVAEGVAGCNESLASFRTEVAEQFEGMRKTFHTSHSQLHRRVSALEAWREQVDPSPPVARKRRS